MKKAMKKLVALVSVMVMMASCLQLSAGAVKVGAVIGKTRPTDIAASINGFQLQSYNVNDYTYICVEDLQYYGFNVVYDNNTRTLSVTRNDYVSFIDPQNENPAFWSIGSKNVSKNILHTDIVTYVNGEAVQSSNIDGYTIINFDELNRFGNVQYSDLAREISLNLSDLNVNPVAIYADALRDELVYNSTWKYQVRAKGDVLVLTLTLRNYANRATVDYFKSNNIAEEKNEAWKILNTVSTAGIPVSSIYAEYKNSDGSFITSFQIP